jgi:3-mercaptopyruvate sulfurtransferase SseA
MKKIVLLILMAFLSLPAPGNAADAAHPELSRIKAKELKQLMDKKSEIILIDSRDSGKYNSGHIEGAVNIHFDPSGDPNVRNMTLMALPMDKLIIIYGDNEDEKASAGLALELYDLGCDMDNLKILSGGAAQWKKQGYPLLNAGN